MFYETLPHLQQRLLTWAVRGSCFALGDRPGRRRAFDTPGQHRVKADALQQGLSHLLLLGFRNGRRAVSRDFGSKGGSGPSQKTT